MPRMTKAAKQIERQVVAAYGRHFGCVQVNMMDLRAIMNVGRDAIREGRDLDEAMSEAVPKFRKN